MGGTNFRVFRDAYTARRSPSFATPTPAFDNELDAAPYVNTHLGATNRDPLDPLRKIPLNGTAGIIIKAAVFPTSGTSINGTATTFDGAQQAAGGDLPPAWI